MVGFNGQSLPELKGSLYSKAISQKLCSTIGARRGNVFIKQLIGMEGGEGGLGIPSFQRVIQNQRKTMKVYINIPPYSCLCSSPWPAEEVGEEIHSDSYEHSTMET